MPGHGSKERRWEQVIAALLLHSTIPAAAKAAGVNEQTVDTYLRNPDFAERYREARRRVVEDAIGTLQKAAGAASAALLKNLKCGQPSVEVQAARAIFDLVMRDETERRLDELETLLHELRGRMPEPLPVPLTNGKAHAPR
jgi:hypothetical protein